MPPARRRALEARRKPKSASDDEYTNRDGEKLGRVSLDPPDRSGNGQRPDREPERSNERHYRFEGRCLTRLVAPAVRRHSPHPSFRSTALRHHTCLSAASQPGTALAISRRTSVRRRRLPRRGYRPRSAHPSTIAWTYWRAASNDRDDAPLLLRASSARDGDPCFRQATSSALSQTAQRWKEVSCVCVLRA